MVNSRLEPQLPTVCLTTTKPSLTSIRGNAGEASCPGTQQPNEPDLNRPSGWWMTCMTSWAQATRTLIASFWDSIQIAADYKCVCELAMRSLLTRCTHLEYSENSTGSLWQNAVFCEISSFFCKCYEILGSISLSDLTAGLTSVLAHAQPLLTKHCCLFSLNRAKELPET